jgi:hypothetical protein
MISGLAGCGLAHKCRGDNREVGADERARIGGGIQSTKVRKTRRTSAQLRRKSDAVAAPRSYGIAFACSSIPLNSGNCGASATAFSALLIASALSFLACCAIDVSAQLAADFG